MLKVKLVLEENKLRVSYFCSNSRLFGHLSIDTLSVAEAIKTIKWRWVWKGEKAKKRTSNDRGKSPQVYNSSLTDWTPKQIWFFCLVSKKHMYYDYMYRSKMALLACIVEQEELNLKGIQFERKVDANASGFLLISFPCSYSSPLYSILTYLNLERTCFSEPTH